MGGGAQARHAHHDSVLWATAIIMASQRQPSRSHQGLLGLTEHDQTIDFAGDDDSISRPTSRSWQPPGSPSDAATKPGSVPTERSPMVRWQPLRNIAAEMRSRPISEVAEPCTPTVSGQSGIDPDRRLVGLAAILSGLLAQLLQLRHGLHGRQTDAGTGGRLEPERSQHLDHVLLGGNPIPKRTDCLGILKVSKALYKSATANPSDPANHPTPSARIRSNAATGSGG
jgi:hypothetical protein